MRESHAETLGRHVSLSVLFADLNFTTISVIDAAMGEILSTCSKMEWLMKHGESALRDETRRSNFMLFYKKSQVIYEPLGVVAAIVSWNYRMWYLALSTHDSNIFYSLA